MPHDLVVECEDFGGVQARNADPQFVVLFIKVVEVRPALLLPLVVVEDQVYDPVALFVFVFVYRSRRRVLL